MFNGVEFGYDQIGVSSFYDDTDTLYNYGAPDNVFNNMRNNARNNMRNNARNTMPNNLEANITHNDLLMYKMSQLEKNNTNIRGGHPLNYSADAPRIQNNPHGVNQLWPLNNNVNYEHSSNCVCFNCSQKRQIENNTEQRQIKKLLQELKTKNEYLTVFIVIAIILSVLNFIYKPAAYYENSSSLMSVQGNSADSSENNPQIANNL